MAAGILPVVSETRLNAVNRREQFNCIAVELLLVHSLAMILMASAIPANGPVTPVSAFDKVWTVNHIG